MALLFLRLELMNIAGKRGRTVPVILTKDIIAALDVLCNQEYREKAGVLKDNQYAFPMTRGSPNNVRGCDAMSDMVKEADLLEPKVFKSTGLRKYIATVSQVSFQRCTDLEKVRDCILKKENY